MFAIKLDNVAIKNDNYIRELYNCPRYCQLTVMSLLPTETIPETTDSQVCKIIHVVSGKGSITVQDQASKSRKHLIPGVAIVILAGATYKLSNSGNKPLKLSIINIPPLQSIESQRRQINEDTATQKSQGSSGSSKSVARATKTAESKAKKPAPKKSQSAKTATTQKPSGSKPVQKKRNPVQRKQRKDISSDDSESSDESSDDSS